MFSVHQSREILQHISHSEQCLRGAMCLVSNFTSLLTSCGDNARQLEWRHSTTFTLKPDLSCGLTFFVAFSLFKPCHCAYSSCLFACWMWARRTIGGSGWRKEVRFIPKSGHSFVKQIDVHLGMLSLKWKTNSGENRFETGAWSGKEKCVFIAASSIIANEGRTVHGEAGKESRKNRKPFFSLNYIPLHSDVLSLSMRRKNK